MLLLLLLIKSAIDGNRLNPLLYTLRVILLMKSANKTMTTECMYLALAEELKLCLNSPTFLYIVQTCL